MGRTRDNMRYTSIYIYIYVYIYKYVELQWDTSISNKDDLGLSLNVELRCVIDERPGTWDVT